MLCATGTYRSSGKWAILPGQPTGLWDPFSRRNASGPKPLNSSLRTELRWSWGKAELAGEEPWLQAEYKVLGAAEASSDMPVGQEGADLGLGLYWDAAGIFQAEDGARVREQVLEGKQCCVLFPLLSMGNGSCC